MEQYIPKSAVVEKIKKRIEHCAKQRVDMLNAQCYTIANDMNERMGELNYIRDFLDTIEVKEVDLEDSIKENLAQKYIDYTFKRHNIDPKSKEGQLIYYAYMHGMNQCIDKLIIGKENVCKSGCE